MAALIHRTALSPSLPVKAGLTPLAFQLLTRHPANNRFHTTSSTASASTVTHSTSVHNDGHNNNTINHNLESKDTPPRAKRPRRPLSPSQQQYLSRALRVNHAGELAATIIYTAQSPPLLKSHPHLRPLMQHMYSQEAGHFSTFSHLLAHHRIRPTVLYPAWQMAATVLGWGTGVMGREAAMACTEAVETEIGGHYNEQARELVGWVEEMESRGEEVGEELSSLVETVRRIRDEELEHLDHAVENDAKMAKPYEVLTGVIRAGCRGAIWMSERV